MANSVLQNVILPAAIIAVCFAAIVGLSGPLDRVKPHLAETYTDSDLSMNGSRLKGFSLGVEGLLADWYWVRALQYIGDKMVNRKDANIDVEDLTSLNPRLLYPLLQNATDLDPHFIGAYSYGAIVLPAIDKQRAIEFAKKGIDHNPNEWKLYQYLGYIYWKVGDYEKAAETYQKGGEIPGSPSFLNLMAASMKIDGGSRATARTIYRQMLSESNDEAVQITANRRLEQLDWFDERDAINETLTAFKDRNGRCANNFGEIASTLMQVKLPEGHEFRIDAGKRLVDPTEVPYKLDKDKCVVTLDIEKTKVTPEN